MPNSHRTNFNMKTLFRRPAVIVNGKRMLVTDRQLDFLRTLADGPRKVVNYYTTFNGLKVRGLASGESDDGYMVLATITEQGRELLKQVNAKENK